MQPYRVSVIMPTYNVQAYVAESIASVAAQSFSSFELVIVDDGSTDDTMRVLRQIAQNWPHAADRLTILQQKNGGAAKARNTGVAACRSDLIAFIDADDRWPPELLEQLVAALDRFPECDIACPGYERIDENGEPVNYLGEPRTAATPSDRRTRTFSAAETLLETPAESATGVMTRRIALEAGGGFDEDLRSNNDVDCWLRILWRRKTTLVQCPDTIADYRIRSEQITSDFQRMRRGHRQFLLNHADLLREIGIAGRMRHFGLVRAYWSLIAARQDRRWSALWFWVTAILLSPRLVLPGTLGSGAALAIAHGLLPELIWARVRALRKWRRSRG